MPNHGRKISFPCPGTSGRKTPRYVFKDICPDKPRTSDTVGPLIGPVVTHLAPGSSACGLLSIGCAYRQSWREPDATCHPAPDQPAPDDRISSCAAATVSSTTDRGQKRERAAHGWRSHPGWAHG